MMVYSDITVGMYSLLVIAVCQVLQLARTVGRAVVRWVSEIRLGGLD